jgi:hypothetical protein
MGTLFLVDVSSICKALITTTGVAPGHPTVCKAVPTAGTTQSQMLPLRRERLALQEPKVPSAVM